MFISRDQSKYIIDYLKAIQSNQYIDDGYISIHYESHNDYVNRIVYRK